MHRRRSSKANAHRRTRRFAQTARLKQRNGCVAVIPIDGGPIRRKIKMEYERAQQQLAKARADLDRHLKEDVPLFDRWLNKTFGALLTALRDTSRQLEEAQSLVFEIEDEHMFHGGSFASAYQRVMYRREHPEPEPAPFGPDPVQDPDGRNGGRTRMDDPFDSETFEWRTGDPFFDEILENLHDAFGDGFAQNANSGRRPRAGGAPGKAPVSAPRASRIKELYRCLVRRLHPDTQEEMSDKKLEWWHQVQCAYQAGDEEQMEVILALCEIEENGRADATSLSLLQRITKHFKSALREIRSRLNRHRKEPAWNFSKRLDRHVLEGTIRWEMETELGQLQHQLAQFQAILASWKADAQRQARRRRKPKPRASSFAEQFLFEEL